MKKTVVYNYCQKIINQQVISSFKKKKKVTDTAAAAVIQLFLMYCVMFNFSAYTEKLLRIKT